jgi:hypothetical protein
MPTQEERLTILEYDLKQYKTETIKAYGEMAIEMTMVKGLAEDVVKRLASLKTEIEHRFVHVETFWMQWKPIWIKWTYALIEWTRSWIEWTRALIKWTRDWTEWKTCSRKSSHGCQKNPSSPFFHSEVQCFSFSIGRLSSE